MGTSNDNNPSPVVDTPTPSSSSGEKEENGDKDFQYKETLIQIKQICIEIDGIPRIHYPARER